MTSSLIGLDASDPNKKVTIGKADQREGTYIIGATGTGKSTLIENLALEDIKNDLGVCVIDPHNALINNIISRMAFQVSLLNNPKLEEKERKKCEHIKNRLENDVIYIDLADQTYVAPFNLFYCEDATDDFEVESIVSAFLHILESSFDITQRTPMMNQYFRHIAFLLAHNQNHTILDVRRLLANDEFLLKLVNNLTDFYEREFWETFFIPHSKGKRRMEDISMITNKLEEFISPVMRPWFGDIKKTIHFRKFMDEKKIVFIKSNPEWETLTKILGNIVIAQLLDAAYSRRNIHPDKRKQMNVYVDEFQKFASSEDFAKLFTEARKYGLGLTIANQVREQIELNIKATCDQAANIIIFRVSPNNAKELAGTFDTTPPPGEMEKKLKTIPVMETISYTVYNDSLRPQIEAIKEKLNNLRVTKWGLCPILLTFQLEHEDINRIRYSSNLIYLKDVYEVTLSDISNISAMPSNARNSIAAHTKWLDDLLNEAAVFGEGHLSYLCNPEVKESNVDSYLYYANQRHYYKFPLKFPIIFEGVFAFEQQHIKEIGAEYWEGTFPGFQKYVNHYYNSRQKFLYELRTVLNPFLMRAEYPVADMVQYQGGGNSLLNAYEGSFQFWQLIGGYVKPRSSEPIGPPLTWKQHAFPEVYLWYRKKVKEFALEVIEVLKEYVEILGKFEKTVTETVPTGVEVADEEIIGYRSDGFAKAIPITRQRYEWVQGRPPYGSDEVEKRTANEIKQLPKYTAKVRIASGEYTIKTIEPTGYVSEKQREKCITEIQERNRIDGYLRLRSEIKEEIRKRNEPLEPPVAPVPNQPKSPKQPPAPVAQKKTPVAAGTKQPIAPPHAVPTPRKVAVKNKQCKTCTAQNDVTAKLCKQCGAQL